MPRLLRNSCQDVDYLNKCRDRVFKVYAEACDSCFDIANALVTLLVEIIRFIRADVDGRSSGLLQRSRDRPRLMCRRQHCLEAYRGTLRIVQHPGQRYNLPVREAFQVVRTWEHEQPDFDYGSDADAVTKTERGRNCNPPVLHIPALENSAILRSYRGYHRA